MCKQMKPRPRKSCTQYHNCAKAARGRPLPGLVIMSHHGIASFLRRSLRLSKKILKISLLTCLNTALLLIPAKAQRWSSLEEEPAPTKAASPRPGMPKRNRPPGENNASGGLIHDLGFHIIQASRHGEGAAQEFLTDLLHKCCTVLACRCSQSSLVKPGASQTGISI